MNALQQQVQEITASFGVTVTGGTMKVHSPLDGSHIADLTADTKETVEQKISQAMSAQRIWAETPVSQREAFAEHLATAIKEHKTAFGKLITIDGGKTLKEGEAEAESSAEVWRNTLNHMRLPDQGGMKRSKWRTPAGVVGLITSFNFPLAVANWTLAPALLAGNAVIWKPSEKTPLVALAYDALFRKTARQFGVPEHLIQAIFCRRYVASHMVAHEQVDVISATGSVGMGQAIAKTLAAKKNNAVPPILELGGNNGMVITARCTKEHIAYACAALMHSFLGTCGQRCTNTRRLFVHRSNYNIAVQQLESILTKFLADGGIYHPMETPPAIEGTGPLIDAHAFAGFEQGKQQATAEGGKIILGRRLFAGRWPEAYYIEPALALMPEQTPVMHTEIFAPLLFVTPYDGEVDKAAALVNTPENAGLVNGIYTQSQAEADRFAQLNLAGHTVINSPRGSSAPAYGMGFGGNRESGTGEILWSQDPLRAFSRMDSIHRVAQATAIAMEP